MQTTLTLHRQRQSIIKIRSMQTQVLRIKALGEDIQAIEKRLSLQLRQDPHMQRIARIPDVGLLTTTAVIATT